jgi:hypothetical protein
MKAALLHPGVAGKEALTQWVINASLRGFRLESVPLAKTEKAVEATSRGRKSRRGE